MASYHIFKAVANWVFRKRDLKTYSRSHTIFIEGKPALNISAAKAFKGDAELLNPEDLLLSSLVSCHMLSYLYVCNQNGIEVLNYSDNAEATLEVLPNGSGRITEVRLRPYVTIANPELIEQALQLHREANKLCFIANSCNFPVKHFAICKTG